MSSVVTALLKYEENVKWFSKHYEALKRKYMDEWVAVLNGTIVDHDRNLNKLVKRLRMNYPMDFNEIAIEYVTANKIEIIL
jgi:hypothetical protein